VHEYKYLIYSSICRGLQALQRKKH